MEYEIKPKKSVGTGLSELIERKELIYFFVWKDLKIKYKQTVLGFLWVILQPLALMLIFTFLLADRFESEINRNDYSIFVVSGFICWNFFSSAVSGSGISMVNNSTIIKKIYFPRLIIPISSALSAMFDFIVCLCIYLGFIFFFKNVEIRILDIFLIPISALLLFFSAFGIGTLISALAVKYRDFRYILPFILQLLLFISPVFLLISPNSSTFFLFSLNPLVAPLQMFRYHLTHTIQWDAILISILSNFFLLFLGLRIFKKMEDYFADLS